MFICFKILLMAETIENVLKEAEDDPFNSKIVQLSSAAAKRGFIVLVPGGKRCDGVKCVEGARCDGVLKIYCEIQCL